MSKLIRTLWLWSFVKQAIDAAYLANKGQPNWRQVQLGNGLEAKYTHSPPNGHRYGLRGAGATESRMNTHLSVSDLVRTHVRICFHMYEVGHTITAMKRTTQSAFTFLPLASFPGARQHVRAPPEDVNSHRRVQRTRRDMAWAHFHSACSRAYKYLKDSSPTAQRRKKQYFKYTLRIDT
jgi:hypothetical protein